MARDSMVLGEDRFFHVDYEELCNCPSKILNDFVKFYYNRTGIELSYRCTLPESFQPSSGAPIEPENLDCLHQHLQELFVSEQEKSYQMAMRFFGVEMKTGGLKWVYFMLLRQY